MPPTQKRLPPATVEALSPPPGQAFPYEFFRDAATHRFDPAKRSFDPRTAWWLCDAAFLAYANDADIRAAYANAPVEAQVKSFAGRRGTACYVASGTEWVVLAFRGTEVNNLWNAALDILTDAHLIPAMDEHGDWVHAGFLASVNEVWEGVRRHVAEEQARARRPLWITGHSLGAGLATIAADRCSSDPALHAAGLYVYASPPVGDRRFAARITMPAFRIANGSDWLPQVPYGLFSPVGRLVYIDTNGHLHSSMASAADALIGIAQQAGSTGLLSAARLLPALGTGVVLPPQIADHAPINYAIRLWNACVG
jgi:hypothetical protein